MKLSIKAVFTIIILSFISYQSHSQSEDTQDYETYSKANIALTSFKILGINNNQFAKCVESINYLEPSKKHKLVIIEGVQFLDDGNNYDLLANDGIMTSIVLFSYSEEATIIPATEYQKLKKDYIFYDSAFLYKATVNNTPQTEGWGISCKLKWVKCSAWPPPYQSICRQFSWPFNGGFELTECTITWDA